MRLSEAIRLGAMMKPQAFHAPKLRGVLAHEVATCALAAACEAAGDKRLDIFSAAWNYRWPVVHQPARCPACRKHIVRVDGCIAHLNDEHQWTREQIADWVEQLESERQPALEDAGASDAVSEAVDQPEAVHAR